MAARICRPIWCTSERPADRWGGLSATGPRCSACAQGPQGRQVLLFWEQCSDSRTCSEPKSPYPSRKAEFQSRGDTGKHARLGATGAVSPRPHPSLCVPTAPSFPWVVERLQVPTWVLRVANMVLPRQGMVRDLRQLLSGYRAHCSQVPTKAVCLPDGQGFLYWD